MENTRENMIYEVSFLLLPTLSEEQVKTVQALGGIFTANGGTILSGEEAVLIDLAYPMTKVVGTTRHKCNSGYFGWVKFELPKDESAQAIAAIKKALDANDEVLRYLIIKTVRENTLLQGKMMLKKEEMKKGPSHEVLEDVEADVDAELAATPEEIDKSIDELVVA